MAKRRAKNMHSLMLSNQGAGALFILILLAVFAANPVLFMILALFAVGCLVAFWIIKKSIAEKSETRFADDLKLALANHEKALISYYNQSRRTDQFGNVDDKKWQRHIDTFLQSQVRSGAVDFGEWRNCDLGIGAAQEVDRWVAERVAERRSLSTLATIEAETLSPLEYEQHCGDLLRNSGWVVTETPPTRDGGADLIAEKGSFRMIVQCKRYAKAVGNKAVQEVTSAVRLYNGNIACVVAPNGFTRQAKTEAQGLSVELLHHTDLLAFEPQVLA